MREAVAADPAAAATPDPDGHAPLQWAALNGRASTAALLLAAGAPVN